MIVLDHVLRAEGTHAVGAHYNQKVVLHVSLPRPPFFVDRTFALCDDANYKFIMVSAEGKPDDCRVKFVAFSDQCSFFLS